MVEAKVQKAQDYMFLFSSDSLRPYSIKNKRIQSKQIRLHSLGIGMQEASWWSHLGLNQGLPDYESGALTN